jgi:hypothetical protein
MSDTTGGSQQQAWENTRTGLADMLLNLHELIESLPTFGGYRERTSVERKIDAQIEALDSVVAVLAEFEADGSAKQITTRWPGFKQQWEALKEKRDNWNNYDPLDREEKLTILQFGGMQLAGEVAITRGYALALPHSPPGTGTGANS